MKRVLFGLLFLLAAPLFACSAVLDLEQGDSICIVGNTLADRMQHGGWLETLIQARYPQHRLRFRNLGFSGDELKLRLRSQDFGTPDEHLAKQKADVVLAFFGYNESYAGAEGLDQFKKDLAEFITHTQAEKYNGENGPKVVVFSPIAHENLKNPDLPSGAENNARLSLYTAAMREVAASTGALFVDLFAPSQRLYADHDDSLTTNGIHPNDRGYRLLAAEIDRALFGEAAVPPAEDRLQAIRTAVIDKNFYWFNRYRTVDGYSIFGGRADLKFVADQTNRDVMQREMEVLDQMADNRDPAVWAAAQGKPYVVDDSNTKPFIPVVTNKPGPGPNGEHLFLGGEESIAKMTVAEGMKVNLYASEEMFPEMINPVQLAWDTKNRLWAAVWPTYPHWKPKERMNDKLLILEDLNGDGKADSCKAFADNLHNPTGFEFWNGGVIVAMAPDLLYLKDTDGDDVADVREYLLHGLDSADTHHTINSFALDPGGALYFQEGTFHHTQVETPWKPSLRSANAAVFRFEPRSSKFDVYVAFGFANPHGHVFDRWGNDIVHDGTGAVPYHGALFSGHTDFPRKHRQPPTLYKQRTRPCSGTEILSSAHFPDELQGNLLVGNVIGIQGILQYKVEPKDSSFVGTEIEPILTSTDPNFRPTDFEIGADGALYFTEWQNPIIGHMQHNLRDPSRDRKHGRVYRVTYPSRPLLTPPQIAGRPTDELLDLLKDKGDRVRSRAKIELGGRDRDEVLATLHRWVGKLDKSDAEYQHHLMEALWVHQYMNVVNEELLQRMLASPDARARAAATRVLCYWRDRVSDPLDLLTKQVADADPLVRLEAVRACSFFADSRAAEVALGALEHPMDEYLQFVLDETLRTLERYLEK